MEQASADLIKTLKKRFEANAKRHTGIFWDEVEKGLINDLMGLKALVAMEATGGEPDVVAYDAERGAYLFMDCSVESPKGRRSLCYDRQSWEERKEFKPEGNVMDRAKEMGVELLNEEDYRFLQSLGPVDTKTSSWLVTPGEIRELGGAIFGDYRYGHVFIYHNGASSYYAARGFRTKIWVGKKEK